MNDQSTLRFQYLDSRTEYPAAVATEFAQARGARGRRVARRVPLRLAQLVRAGLAPGSRPDVPRRLGLHRARRRRPRPLRVQPHVLRRPGRRGTRTGASAYKAAARRPPAASSSIATSSRSSPSKGRCSRSCASAPARARSTGTAQTYDLQGAFMFGQFRPRSGLNINMQINRGEQIDYTNSRLADQRRFQPQIDWNATRHLLVRLRYTSDRLSTKEGADDLRRQADGLAADVAVQRAQLRALDAAGSGHRAQRRPLRRSAHGSEHVVARDAAPVLVQAEPADRAVRGLLRQQHRRRCDAASSR